MLHLSFRAKLLTIVGTAAFAFIALLVISSVIAAHVDEQLAAVQLRYVPKVELGPQLEAQFDHLKRGFQDAVAARDGDALDDTREMRDVLLEQLASAQAVFDPAAIAAFRKALEDYYGSARDVSQRMIDGETGEALVNAMGVMQARQTQAKELLAKATAFDRAELTQLFAAAANAQRTAGRVRLAVGIGCLVFVTLLSLWLSRGVLAAVARLSSGFERFGRGDFDQLIPADVKDELGELAQKANAMAESLKRLSQEREQADWHKSGLNVLMQELRGELEPNEVGARAVRQLARHLQAMVGAVYYRESADVLRLLGEYAGTAAADGDGPPGSFRFGEGLIGQACLQEDISVVHEPPPDHVRVRSGFLDGPPRVLVFLPLVHARKVTGVVELGFFKPWSEKDRQFLLSVRETVSVAIEVARARRSMRELLAETERQKSRLLEQEAELHASNEELHTQQEELRQTNEELTRQTNELETQRRTLTEKNAELDEAGRLMRQKADELLKVSSYKSQFLANMSHELRTPLNSMLLLSNLLTENEGGNLSDKQVEFARTIHGAGKDLLALINQVLDLAKVEAGKTEVRVEPVVLGTLVDHAERVFRPLAEEKGLAFEVMLDPGLPETIRTDMQRLQQILNNLLANAIKFTERGRVSLKIKRPESARVLKRASLVRDRTVVFAVSDTGVGIAPEHHERVFAPFEQVEAASDRRFGGTGLGLTIAREMAQLLGGEVSLESTIGQGSTFACCLPFDAPTAVDAGDPAQSASSPANGASANGSARQRVQNGVSGEVPASDSQPSSSRARPRVHPAGGAKVQRPPEGYLLVVEDDAVFAQVVGEVIGRQGLQYEIAADGASALRLCRERPPSGVILDIKLPDVDGWRVIEELREDPRTQHIPVHFVSGADAKERALALGAVGYLAKPASRQDLVNAVEALVPKQSDRSRHILVVEEDKERGDSLVKQLLTEELEAVRVSSAQGALEALRRERFACMILDLSLPDMDGLDLLQSLQEQYGAETPSVVVYSSRPLSKTEAQRVDSYAEAVVLREGSSTERLLDEVRLFVRRLKAGLGPRRAATAQALPFSVRLEGQKILVVDDDMRTVYALSATLRAKGAQVIVADTGKAALRVLGEQKGIDVVLMDIMMPEMDGYETIRRIRQELQFGDLFIVALTAKAMKGDREKCLEIGASDYLPKPIDPERLLALLHARLAAAKAAAQGGALAR